MQLPLDGQRVTRISFQYGIEILLSGGTTITIETPFEIDSPQGSVRINPQQIDDANPVLQALHDEVVDAAFSDSGQLRIQFRRSEWVVHPDPEYESWGVSTPGTPSRVQAGPGADNVAVWS